MDERESVQDESSSSSSSCTVQACPSDSELAGRAEVCAGCPGRELCMQQGGGDPDQQFIDVRMNAVKRKIVILSGKGGVGKSSIAACLSVALATLGKKVGLLDLDICGPSIPHLMGIDRQQVTCSEYGWTPLKSHCGVKVISTGCLLDGRDTAVVWRGPRKTADTPPGTSDEHLTVVRTLMNTRPEGAVIVTTPQELALATISKEINFCRKMKLPILGVVNNMDGFVCPCCEERYDIFSPGGMHQLISDYDLPLLGSIPLDPSLVSCCEAGHNLFHEYPSSPAATTIMSLATQLDNDQR